MRRALTSSYTFLRRRSWEVKRRRKEEEEEMEEEMEEEEEMGVQKRKPYQC